MKHRHFTRLAAALSSTCALAFGLLPAPTAAQVKWDLPSAYAPGNFHTENLQIFAKDVDAATGGKLKITVHPGASLFKAPEIKRAVQSGQAQLGEILLANYENENPIFGLDGVPFLATSYANARRLYTAQKPALDKYLEAQGLRLLFTVPWQPQGIYSKKPIEAVADLRGVKWRAYSVATSKMAELMAMQPVTVQAAELSQAMATGVVDAYISSSATGVDTKTYESLKYFYDAQAWLPKNAVLVSIKALTSLDPAAQQALLKAAAEAETRGWKSSEEKDQSFKKILADRGMQVLPTPVKLSADLNQVGGIMLTDWQKKSGKEGEALVATYLNERSANSRSSAPAKR